MKLISWLLIVVICMAFPSCSSSSDEPQTPSNMGPYVANIEAHNSEAKNRLTEQLIGDYNRFNTKLEVLINFGKAFGEYVEEYKGANLPFIQNYVFTDNEIRTFPGTSMVFDIKPNINIGGSIVEMRIGVAKYDEGLLNKVRGHKGFYINGKVENVEINAHQISYNYIETIEITYSPVGFDLIPMSKREN
ncbi:MAG: hypothetical protein NC421_07230 [Lachnospiraceae bacterium]|nr:hypothetical protein [Lachnospiraceae bacterium]